MDHQTALTPYQFTIDAAIAEWLSRKEMRTGSKRTRSAYKNTLESFRVFLRRWQIDLLDNPVDIARLAAQWANERTLQRHHPETDLSKPVSPTTYNQRLAILSSWYTFVQKTYHLAQVTNPVKEIEKRPVQAYATMRYVDLETVEAGLGEIDRRTPAGMRDYALLAVALATGRRASELVGLRGQDIVIVRGKRTGNAITLTFHCKGQKVMRDSLDAASSAVLLEYLHIQFGEQLHIPPDAPLWVSYSRHNRGQAIDVKTLSRICQKHLETSKSHALRHTFSHEMVKVGAPLTDLQVRLGHSDIKTTTRYGRELVNDENPHAAKLTARFGIKPKFEE